MNIGNSVLSIKNKQVFSSLIGEIMIFKIIAIMILLTFYGCYFGKMALQSKKGIKTDQIGKGKVGLVKFIEITMKIVTIVVPIIEIFSIFIIKPIFPTFMRSIGVAVGILGVIVFICSVVTMKDSWRAGVQTNEKTELVTEGIYKISRNPAFLGFDLVYIGILCMFFNYVQLIASLFAIVMFHLQIVKVEEDFLIKTFGDEYLVYKKKVNRYIGVKCDKN